MRYTSHTYVMINVHIIVPRWQSPRRHIGFMSFQLIFCVTEANIADKKVAMRGKLKKVQV